MKHRWIINETMMNNRWKNSYVYMFFGWIQRHKTRKWSNFIISNQIEQNHWLKSKSKRAILQFFSQKNWLMFLAAVVTEILEPNVNDSWIINIVFVIIDDLQCFHQTLQEKWWNIHFMRTRVKFYNLLFFNKLQQAENCTTRLHWTALNWMGRRLWLDNRNGTSYRERNEIT